MAGKPNKEKSSSLLKVSLKLSNQGISFTEPKVAQPMISMLMVWVYTPQLIAETTL